jgi:hypothetical protein
MKDREQQHPIERRLTDRGLLDSFSAATDRFAYMWA